MSGHNKGKKYKPRFHDLDFAAIKRAEDGWRAQLGTIPVPETLNQALLGDPCSGRSALDKCLANSTET